MRRKCFDVANQSFCNVRNRLQPRYSLTASQTLPDRQGLVLDNCLTARKMVKRANVADRSKAEAIRCADSDGAASNMTRHLFACRHSHIG